jgi:uncharacterized repeat protein (TIGR01451 family)
MGMRRIRREPRGAAARVVGAVLGLLAAGALATGLLTDTAPTASAQAVDPADLSVSITDSPDPVATGAALTYTVRVRNAGPDPATGTTLTDSIPSGVTFVSATPSAGDCDRSGRKITCDFGTLASSAERTVTIRTTVTRKSGEMTNSASVSSEVTDPNPNNNLDTELTKISNPEPVKCGGRTVTIFGTLGPDTVFGTAGDDVILADDGDDLVFGFRGRDVICGGTGSDVVRSGGGNDLVLAGRGSDFAFGRRGDDDLRGNRGRDRLRGGAGDDLLAGGRGFDRCRGGGGRDHERNCER